MTLLRRNILLALGAFALSAWGRAQAQGRLIRIGMISSASPAVGGQFFEAFRKGMRELGYLDGQNVEYFLGYAEGRNERIETLAREYVERRVDVIIAGNSTATAIAQNATRTIPILMVAADPVDFGLIASLARPGGNTTGLSSQFEDTLLKMIQLLKEVGVDPVWWRVNGFRDGHSTSSEGDTEIAPPWSIVAPEGTERSPLPWVRSKIMGDR